MYKNIKNLLFSAALLLCCLTASAVGTQPSTGDGSQANPYQIATADNLVWFADYVNSGNTSACAILTENITMNANVLDSDGNLNGTPSNIWTPIGGQNGKDYSGEFDGNGHTISGLYFNDGTQNNVGLFGKAVGNAHIHDLGIKDSYFYGQDHVGGICGDFASGRIENCWSEVTVYVATGDGGGLTGSVYINAVLTNCYSICNVSGNGSRGLVCGAFYGTIENCYAQNRNSTGTTSLIGWTSEEGPHTATNVEIKDAAAFASGEVCWLLNNGVTDGTQKWYQTLGGTDNFPVLDNSHGTVYYGYDGNVLTYSNSPLIPVIDNVAYIDANGQPQTADNVTIIGNASEQVTWSAGWYVVQGTDITLAKGAVCNGAVHLILADDAKLTATGDSTNKTPGIQVSGDGNSLAIYGQTAQSGQLIANGGYEAAGVGGGYEGSGSNITINGGIVTANGGQFGAGIGGGHFGSGIYITINNGTVTAKGGEEGAGIGGGGDESGSNITINGGVVTANGGKSAAGIGGGDNGSSSYISITGGSVSANGGEDASCIGRGKIEREAYSSHIFVTADFIIRADNYNPPASVIAANRTAGTDIASYLEGKRYATIGLPRNAISKYGDYITVYPEFASGTKIPYGTYTFTAEDRSAEHCEFLGFYMDSTFDHKITNGVSGLTYTVTVTELGISVYAKYRQPTPYIDADGQEKLVDAIEITGNTLNAGWYVVFGNNVQTGSLTCNGDVHLILADGAKLTANGWYEVAGINVSGEGNSLTIYGQSAQSGQLIANGGELAAGIGGIRNNSGSNITINGGVVTANGGRHGAGIGGGTYGSGSYIKINGGTVTANGGEDGAGIGGGGDGSGSNITITGGTVTANGGRGGAGIGGGHSGSSSNITITGGTVTANGGEWATSIGKGYVWQGNSSSSIFVATDFVIRADNNNPPETEVAASRTAETDIAVNLDGRRYATIRIPRGSIVSYGDYISVSPAFASGDRIASETEVTFTAADRSAGNYEFLGFYRESTFENKITDGVNGLTYTTTAFDDDISVYAKYEEFTPIPYIDADGQERSVNATEITNASTTLNAGWYVVLGNDVQTGSLTCNGAVKLILADGAKLTATGGRNYPGITVSGEGNSLTIYGQTAQSGQLIAEGGQFGAGIGGINYESFVYYDEIDGIHYILPEIVRCSGSNITINGGIVKAIGGECGAGIGGGNGSTDYYPYAESNGFDIIINGGTVTAIGGTHGAGIGGGQNGYGYNITINGGEVTATGGTDGAGIGRGWNGAGSNIRVATALTVYAGNSNPPSTEILHTDNDIASYIAALRYVIVKDVTTGIKDSAIAAINAAIEGVTNADIIAIATNAIDAINAAINQHEIEALKEQALAAIAALKAAYAEGQAEGLGEMGTPCDDCPAVEVTKGTKTIRLYNPDKVEFKKE